MNEKKLTVELTWHLVEDEGNPQGYGQFIVTTETGSVLPAKYDNCLMEVPGRNEHVWEWRWKLNKGVKVLAWAEMPEPCEACPIEVIKARKELERAKVSYEKALAEFNKQIGEHSNGKKTR